MVYYPQAYPQQPQFNPYFGAAQDNLAQLRQQQQPQPPAQNGIIWVQGEEAAKAYLVAPNTTVQLWDSENKTIYLKSADASGMPTMRILDFVERTGSTAPAEPAADYVTRKEFDDLKAKVEALTKDE